MAMSELKYFQQRTDERLASIEEKIDVLLEFKNLSTGKMIGITVSVSAIVSLAVGLVSVYFSVN